MSNRTYTNEQRQEIRDLWKKRIHSWKQSNLSGAAWCRVNEIPYQRFQYWKELFCRPSQDEQIQFIELKESQPSEFSGIEVCMNEISLRLTKEFDEKSLTRCIKVIREAAC